MGREPPQTTPDPTSAIIGLPTGDDFEPYIAFEYLLLRYNPRTRGHEVLVLVSWKDDALTTLTAPSVLFTHEAVRQSVAGGRIPTTTTPGPPTQTEDEELYRLTRDDLVRALLELETRRGLVPGPEGNLAKQVGTEFLTILHSACTTRHTLPQHEGATKKLRVETFVMRQEYHTSLSDPTSEHWGKSVSWPHSHPTPLSATAGPTCTWMGVREFVAAQPYHTRLGPQPDCPHKAMPHSSEHWCELLVEWGSLRLLSPRPTLRPTPTQGPATFTPMDRDPPHYDHYQLLVNRKLLSIPERNNHVYCMDHRNSLGWCAMGYVQGAMEMATNQCAYHFLSGGPRPTPTEYRTPGSTRYCTLRVPFQAHTTFRELRDQGILIPLRTSDEAGCQQDWRLPVPIYYPPIPMQHVNKLPNLDRLVWVPERQPYTYDTHQWRYNPHPPDGLDLLHALILDRFPPLLEHLDTLAQLWRHDHCQVYLLYCALLGAFPVVTPKIFTYLWRCPTFTTPWPGLYHYIQETMANDPQVASPIQLPLLGAPGAPAPEQTLPLPPLHLLGAALVQVGVPGWHLRSEPTLSYCWDSRDPSDWRNSSPTQLPPTRLGIPWRWTPHTPGTTLRGLWGTHAGVLYRLSHPTEHPAPGKLLYSVRSVRCAMCDYVASSPHEFALHAVEKHSEEVQRQLHRCTPERWAATTMEIANMLTQLTGGG